MNAFSRQDKALPSEVRNQIIEKWLSNDGITNISRQSNLPCETVRNIVQSQGSNSSLIFASYFGILIQFFSPFVQNFSLVIHYFSSVLQYLIQQLANWA